MNPKLLYYIGAECLGTRKEGFKVQTFRGTMTLGTLAKVEELPNCYSVKPYLRPLSKKIAAQLRVEYVGVAYQKHQHFTEDIYALRVFADVTNKLREEGYDVDGLLDSGDALLHPDHDAKSLI